jgi:hypothetical protein
MWKIGANKQTSVMDKKKFNKFLIDKQVVERILYYWNSSCIIKKYTHQRALKLSFWGNIRVYPKNYKDNQLKDFNFYPKKCWNISVYKNLYYITKLLI